MTPLNVFKQKKCPSLSSEAGVQGPDGAHVTELCVSSAQL